MQIRFFGVRGSLAKPGPSTVRYGGNTSCVQVKMNDGRRLIFDSGTGIHDLGQEMMKSSESPIKVNLLITHTHWDHIQGFPFFTPLYILGNEVNIYGPGRMGGYLSNILSGQMVSSYFPVNLESLGATVKFVELGEGVFEVDGVHVSTFYTNHPSQALGYSLETGGVKFVYIPDHEPHSLHAMGSEVGAFPVHHEDQNHVKFMEDADLVIHDAQYTLEEYPSKVGWGHSPYERVVDYAIAARAKRLALFHHDPLRNDEEMDGLVEKARQRASGAEFAPEVFASKDNLVIELVENPIARIPDSSKGESALLVSSSVKREKKVLIVDGGCQMIRLLESTLQEDEGITFHHACDAKQMETAIFEKPPDLILLDLEFPGVHGLDVCRFIRQNTNSKVNNVPIIVIAGKRFEQDDILECFAAGATDYMTKEFAVFGLQSRVRDWLMRSSFQVDRRKELRRSRGERGGPKEERRYGKGRRIFDKENS